MRKAETACHLQLNMQLAENRGWLVAEGHKRRSVHTDSIRIELETGRGVTTVEGAVFLEKPRLTQVDGIYCEVALAGFLIFMKNRDVPGVGDKPEPRPPPA
jgi:hypothetical protein